MCRLLFFFFTYLFILLTSYRNATKRNVQTSTTAVLNTNQRIVLLFALEAEIKKYLGPEKKALLLLE